jgi:hypothetical protein
MREKKEEAQRLEVAAMRHQPEARQQNMLIVVVVAILIFF